MKRLEIIPLKVNRILVFGVAWLCILLSGCDTDTLVDVNLTMPSRNWTYVNKVKAVVVVADHNQPLDIYFNLRHTNDYRYSNIFVLLHINGAGQKESTIRYQFKLAQPDGKWNGAGSGNIFGYTFRLLTDYKFPINGKYELEVEQNMRDNPLREISDAGITVLKQGK